MLLTANILADKVDEPIHPITKTVRLKKRQSLYEFTENVLDLFMYGGVGIVKVKKGSLSLKRVSYLRNRLYRKVRQEQFPFTIKIEATPHELIIIRQNYLLVGKST